MNNDFGISLSSQDFESVLKAAMLCGLKQLENGGETYRAEDTVMRICSAFDCPDSEVIAFPTGLIITLKYNGKTVGNSVQRVRKRTIDLAKLSEANNISRSLASGKLQLGDAIRMLENMNRVQPITSKLSGKLLYALIAAISTAFFAVLYGGSFFDAVIAFICGGVVQLVSSMMKSGDLFKFAISLLGGGIIALFAVMGTAIFGIGSVDKIIMGAIIPLLPGLALTTAIRDTMNGDLISGCARLCEVVLVAFALAAGVGIVFSAYTNLGGVIINKLPAPSSIPVRLIKDLIYAVAASAFFSVLIGSPKKTILTASIVGALGYIVYDIIMIASASSAEVSAFFFGTLFMSLVSEILARTQKMPSITFTTPAIVPLVPGVGIYKTMLFLILDDFSSAVSTGVTTLLTTGAMAIAIAGASVAVSKVHHWVVKKK